MRQIDTEYDVAIIGAGPAGLSAAIETARWGAKTAVFDLNLQAGGQLFKQIHKFFGSKEHFAGERGYQIGKKLLERAKESGVDIYLNALVFGSFNHTLGVSVNEHLYPVTARKIILATGAKEKVVAFPNWTLPGVMGAGALQTLVNINRVLPGKRVLMVGGGNVGLIVSYQLLQAGAQVTLIEAKPHLTGYVVHVNKLKRKGVPIFTSTTVKRAEGKESVEEVILVKVDENLQPIAGTEFSLKADVVALAVGLEPQTEIARLLGCSLSYQPEKGGYFPLHNSNLETSVKGVFVAGDITGVEEASIAMEEGRLAAISACADLSLLPKRKVQQAKEEVRARLKELRQKYSPKSSQNLSQLKKLWLKNFKKKRVALIECFEEIPCNPCEQACPRGAIKVGKPLTNLPTLDEKRCNGCGLCIPSCPGLAIRTVEVDPEKNKAFVSLPYEFLPLPHPGEKIFLTDAQGKIVEEGKVVKVQNPPRFNKTAVITVETSKEHVWEVESLEPQR